jgi:hypothetical protein
MTPQNFCYWLQGWFELNRTVDHRDGATPETMKMIEEHLALVFKEEYKVANPPVQGTSVKSFIDGIKLC